MAKAVILQCDQCGEWDSDENKVQTIGVAGPRFDLCARDRARVIESMGIDPEKAAKFVTAFDKRRSHRGAPPALDGLSGDESDPEPTPEEDDGLVGEGESEVDDDATAEDTEPRSAGRRSGKR